MSKLLDFWYKNIQKNYKLISAFLTEIIITAILIIAYGLRGGLLFGDILFMIWVSVNSSLFIILRLIGKGEVAEIDGKYKEEVQKNNALKQQAEYNQVIAGYAIQLAAMRGEVPESIIANEKWIKTNELLKKINGE